MSSSISVGEEDQRAPCRDDYRGAVVGLIGSAAAVAVIVLLGWLLHLERFKRLSPGLTAMNPMTATCFLALALTLWLLRDERPRGGWRRGAVSILPLLTLLVGSAKLLDLATGSSLCPDDILFSDQLGVGQAYPNRIAPNVAICFVILSLAMLCVDRQRGVRIPHSQWLVTPVIALAAAALVGYAYDSSGFYRYRQYIPMALHSAVNFLFLTIALVLSRPEQGYLRLIPRRSSGARSAALLLPACVLIPFALGWFSLLGSDRGWFEGRGTATSIVTVLTAVVLVLLAFYNAVTVNRTENLRREANSQLRGLVAQLDEGNRQLKWEIAERKRMEERALYQATHDPLTGLPNRLLFLDRLQMALERTTRHHNVCALFYVDVDNFKPVNDVYGHQAGDRLLQELAERIRLAMRAVDTVARLGGDEFAAIMDAPASAGHALELASRVIAAASKPYVLMLKGAAEAIRVEIGISVGIALFPGHASDSDSLIRLADSAMYNAKANGKSRCIMAA